jgi:flagella basal body P-ring formation protein FlgA
MKTFAFSSRFALISVAAAVFVGFAGVGRADTLASATPAAREPAALPQTPFTRDQLMATLTRLVTTHFNLEGELQLELIRPWTPPARVAALWDLTVVDYPAVPTSSMMFRCRVLADAAVVAETTFVVRAQLWRDAWSARPIPAGRTLTWRDIARRPLVKKGELVEVTAVDGPLAVSMKALAMENGAQGDTVTVRNPESRKDFAAMVVSENRVQVRF